MIIDVHTHVFPDLLGRLEEKLQETPWGASLAPAAGELVGRVNGMRKLAREWLKPLAGPLHEAQTMVRHLPGPARHGIDQLGALVPIPGLLLQSTLSDLEEAMAAAKVDHSVIIAHAPAIPNEFILEASQENPALIAAVNIPMSAVRPGALLKKYANQGAKLLKIHASADGEALTSPRYQAVLKTAADLGMPVILHTGCFHSHLYYKNPELSQARNFEPWFKKYPQTRFILAHMNFHDPHTAMDLAEEYGNVLLDTSWQPAETVGEAVRRVGAERVLYGTDWPFIGQNFEIGMGRIQDCVDSGILKREEADLILGENAAKLLGLA